MRNLFWVSLLATAGMLYGCGYGDGKDLEDNTNTEIDEDKPLMRLAETCTSNLDCMDVTTHTVIGDCIAGECRRFCNSSNLDLSRECEKNTICEAGICQPLVDCPNVAFKDNSKNNEYANSKCVKIFNITPSFAWKNLLTKDLVFSKENKELFGKTTDFTSDNFTFELPKEVISDGVNFSMITYMAINYLKLELVGATALAQCTKPQIKQVNGTYVDIPQDDDIPYTYLAHYAYSLSDDPITNETMMLICDNATYHMDDDMDKYYEYLTTEGSCQIGDKIENEDDQMKCVVEAYTEMLENKHECKLAQTGMELIKVFSNALMTAGMTDLTNSTSYEGAEQVYNWIDHIDNQYIYQSGFNKSKGSGAHNIDLECPKNSDENCILGIYPIKYCDVASWKENILKNNDLYRKLSSAYANNDNVSIDIDTVYKNSKDRIRFCSEEDVGVVENNEDEANKATLNGIPYYFDSAKASDANKNMIKKHAMRSQLGTCIYMMNGTNEFSLMKAMAKSNDIKLKSCGMHSSLKDATINASYITENATSSVDKMMAMEYNNIFDLLDKLKVLAIDYNSGNISRESQELLEKIESIDLNSLNTITNLDSLYQYTTDPSLIWLPGDSLFPVVININSEGESNTFKSHDLILDIVYKPKPDMFINDPTVLKPLTSKVSFDSYQDSYVDKANQPFKPIENSAYVSTFDYTNTSSHATLLYRQNDYNLNCPYDKCTFYITGHKAEGSGMICGGVTFPIDHIDGYIVTKLSDKFGNKELVSEN